MSRIDLPIESPLDMVCEVLSKSDEFSAAKTLLMAFERIWPSASLEALDELSRNHYRTKNYTDSIRLLEKSLSMAQTNESRYQIRGNLAKMYNHINLPLKSLAMSKLNHAQNPNSFDTLMEIQFSEYLLGNLDRSEDILKQIAESPLCPEDVRKRVLFNLGTYDLYHGRLQEGLKGFITGGKAIGIWPDSVAQYRKWNGSPTNETLYIIEEGGIGDSIINARFAKISNQRGVDTVWVTLREDLKTVYNRNGIKTIMMSEFKSLTDPLVAGAMDMPVLLNIQADELWTGPYLQAAPEYVEKWSHLKGMVGAKWAGNPLYEQDLHRSISAVEINDVVPIGKVIVSLQIDNDDDMVDVGFKSVNIQSWEDTLGILANLDYTITSCTSVAHAAASIGAKVYVMVPRAAYYTWCWDRKDPTYDHRSIWYGDNVMYFQKEGSDSWDSAFEVLSAILNNSN